MIVKNAPRYIVAFVVWIGLVGQSTPSLSQSITSQTDQYQRQPESSPPALTLDLEALPSQITVQEIRYQGNTAYSSAELDAVIQADQVVGSTLSLPEILQLTSLITRRYVEDGYITSGAYLGLEENPPAQLEAGVVTLQILEGELESIEITGLRRLRPGYVRQRIQRGAQKPLNQEALLQSLQLLQLDPLIESLSSELAAGPRAGTSILQVEVTEAFSFDLSLSTDNNRSPSVGSMRRILEVQEGNLLGWGDRLRVGYVNTEGSDKLETSYTVPLNGRDGSLSFRHETSANRVIEEPFDAVDIRSPAELFEISLRQPLQRTPTEELALGLTATTQRSETSLLGIPIQLSEGADSQGRTRVSALRFFQEYTRRNDQSVFALRSQFNVGLDLFDASINPDQPDSRFFSWRGQAQYVRLTAPDTLLVVRSDVQLADQALLPLEQLGLGGQQTVRGYRQDVLITDNGANASLEYRIPLYRSSRRSAASNVLQVIPFVDMGVGWNSQGQPNPDPNFLASTGLGLLWQSEAVTARFDWGIPLTRRPTAEARTWQENGLYFSLQTRLF